MEHEIGVTSWANGFGVWHVRVPRSLGERARNVARRVLRDELDARYADVAREVWLHAERVPELDDADTIAYREWGVFSRA